ncbi:hypothetical protein AGMMS50233_10120 [Endomicrobiia bacterium]|nr:hypothetical protein AGMMS50233_10120 [Endomicrobiia bacterium]
MGLDHVKDQDELIESDIKKQHDELIESDVKKLMDSDGIKQEITQDAATEEATAYITRLLKKRKWTGEEAGKTLVYNLIKNLGREPTVEENGKWKTIAEIYSQKLQNFTETDKPAYLEYYKINQWLLRAHALAIAHRNSFIIYSTRISEPINMISNAELISHRITEISNEQDPVLCHLLCRLTLDKFTTKNKKNEKEIENIKSARNNLLEEFYFTRGYCKAIELITDYLKINALNMFQIEMKILYENILTLNIAMEKIASITNNHATGVEKAKKLEILKKVFEPIEITWHISDNTIATAQERLRKKEVFKNDALYFIGLFTTQEELQ